MILTLFLATYPDILASWRSSTPYGMPSLHQERSPTSLKIPKDSNKRDCGGMLEPRVIFRADSLDQ